MRFDLERSTSPHSHPGVSVIREIGCRIVMSGIVSRSTANSAGA